MSYSSSTTIIGSVSTIPSAANIGSLPATVSDGTLRWVDSDSSIYVYNGTGWTRLSSEYTLDAKQAVDYATAAALPAVTYDNGPSGVGATLAADANGALSVDGASPTVGQRILVKDQAATLQNGIYEVTATGDGANPFVLTRTTDFDGSDEVDGGEFVYVRAGSTLAQTGWQQTAVTPTIGTDPIVWAQISGGGSGGGTVTLQDAYDDTVPAAFPLGGNSRYLDVTSDPIAITANQNIPVPHFFAHTTTGGWDTVPMGSLNLGTTSSVHAVNNIGTARYGSLIQQSDGGSTTIGLLPVWNLSGFAGSGLNVSSVQSTTPPIIGGAMIQSYNGVGGTVEYTQNLTYTSLTGGVPAVGDAVTGSSSLATGTVRALRENVVGTSGEIVIGNITGLFTVADTLSDGVWSASGLSLTVPFNSLPSLVLAFNQGTVNGRTDIDTGLLSASNHSGGTTNIPVLYVEGSATQNARLAVFRQKNTGSTTGPMVLFDQQNTSHADPTIQIANAGDTVDIQLTARLSDPTNLVDGGLWFNTTDNALKSSDGTGLFRVITAEESQSFGPLTVDKHTINRPLVFAASAQAVPTGSTIFYNDVADVNSIPLAVINNAAAGFGAIWDNLTGASLTVLSQFQNTGTVNAAGAVVAIQSQDGSTNNGQALLVVQNQDSLGGNDVPLIKLNHLAGTGTGDAVDIQFTARTADPTTLVDGGLWFNTSDNQMKFSDGAAVYPLVHLEDGTNRGSLNLPVLAADPSAPSDGDVWLFDNGGVRAIRARMGGTTYGVTLT